MIDVRFSMFFDRTAVTKSVDAASKKVLSKFGSFVRRTAKSSVRKRKKISTPGSPPSSHTGKLKDLIFFGYDQSTKSVVIGPQLYGSRRGKTAPNLLEFGGTTTGFAGKVSDYKPRPFMGPAFQKELPGFAGLFANTVKG